MSHFVTGPVKSPDYVQVPIAALNITAETIRILAVLIDRNRKEPNGGAVVTDAIQQLKDLADDIRKLTGQE